MPLPSLSACLVPCDTCISMGRLRY